MSNWSYLTIEKPSEGFFKNKGSRFISFIFPVSDENEVKKNLENLKNKYHDARHHCYAYRIGINGDYYRMNDDGEPSGTGGKPIYGQIISKQLTNVLIVVIRYFGGILLGTGGLIQAYKAAASNCIDNAIIIKKELTLTLNLQFNYDKMNEVMKIMKEEQIENAEYNLGTDCKISFEISLNARAYFEEKFTLISDINLSFKEKN